ncbi:hypothetical protein C8F04DRAFT_1193073 [Mycena alexandri]|uniref:Uncharacterized protein n=1 Tax=Mycena alexandri TaxID=1745969 RepID=A0AAD6SBX9_9AGAR|nr:hypothetical protein C8F04DRAFT_1193073 [Mycena alexandri]
MPIAIGNHFDTSRFSRLGSRRYPATKANSVVGIRVGGIMFEARRSVVAIPELLDLTIDHLFNSKPDLYACALVSKVWIKRAQYHLFSTVSISRALENDADADGRAITRLEETLVHSPHLASLVKHLDITLEPAVLATIAQIPLSALRQVTVHCTLQQRRERADAESVADVQRLLRLPTVKMVNLMGRFPSIPVLNAYFRGCSPSIITIKGVHAGGFKFVEPPPTDEGIPLSPKAEAPRLNLVALLTSTGFEKWLRNPGCPFGFSRLSMVVITTSLWPSFRHSLAPNLHHLQCLKLFICTSDIDLYDLPSLRKLEILIDDVDPEPGLSALLAALAKVSSKSQVATVNVRLHALGLTEENALRQFDARLMTLSKTVLPALRRVEFDVPLLQVDYAVPPLETNVSISQFKSWLSLVDAKQWLDVDRRYTVQLDRAGFLLVNSGSPWPLAHRNAG